MILSPYFYPHCFYLNCICLGLLALHLFQFQFIILSNTMISFKLRFVFGLLVMCVFYLLPSEAQIKFPMKKIPLSTSPRRPVSLPSTSQSLNLNRQHSLPSTLSISKSMESINLHSRSSSLSSFNTAKSPSLMVETKNLHKQAASLLDLERINTAQRQSGLIQRLSSSSMKTMGKYSPKIVTKNSKHRK